MQPSPRAGRPHSGTAAAPRGRPGRGRQGRGTGTPGGRARAPGRGAGWVCVNLLQACEAGARDGQQETEKKTDKNTRKAAKKNRNVPKSKKNAKTHTHTQKPRLCPLLRWDVLQSKKISCYFLGGLSQPCQARSLEAIPSPACGPTARIADRRCGPARARPRGRCGAGRRGPSPPRRPGPAAAGRRGRAPPRRGPRCGP